MTPFLTHDQVLADIGVGGNVTWTLPDHQKTARDLATFDGTITSIANHRTFSSFGQMLSQSNAAVDHLFGYTGRELDVQTGLNYHRSRWYDAGAGEFLTPDPLGFSAGDTNLTRFVGNSPNDYTDPTGNSWLSKLFRKVKREVKRVVNQVREAVHDAVDDVREFVDDHPVIAGLAALGTGAWFVAASGGIAGAFANLGSLASKAVGSISTGFTSASSGIGGSFSLNVGNFASLSVGAGISGTSAFAGMNLSVLGLPLWGVGPTVGVFGNVSDSVASTLAGNFSDAVSRTVLSGTSSINVGSFVRSVAKNAAIDYGYSQVNQTGLPLAYGVATQTAAFAGDVYGAFHDVLTPRVPVYHPPAATAGQSQAAGTFDPETGLYRLDAPQDAVYLQPQGNIWSESGFVQPGIYYGDAGDAGFGVIQADGRGISNQVNVGSYDPFRAKVLYLLGQQNRGLQQRMFQAGMFTYGGKGATQIFGKDGPIVSVVVGGDTAQEVANAIDGYGITPINVKMSPEAFLQRDLSLIAEARRDTGSKMEALMTEVVRALPAGEASIAMTRYLHGDLDAYQAELEDAWTTSRQVVADPFKFKREIATAIVLGTVALKAEVDSGRKSTPNGEPLSVGASSRVDIQNKRVYSLQPSNDGKGPPRWTRMNGGPSFTDADRVREWKRLAADPNSGLSSAERVQIAERGNRGPQRLNEYGELETMELSHEPIPLRDGGTSVVPRWPADHAAIDSRRHLKNRN
ncbi:MAG: RHS repeat-associated core domain-containing protein [Planctomycetaceae bacterium]